MEKQVYHESTPNDVVCKEYTVEYLFLATRVVEPVRVRRPQY
jgi:hypothetical protein